MNKTNKTLLLIAILAGLAFLFVFLTQDTKEISDEEIEFKTEFLSDCYEADNALLCNCGYNYILDEIGLEEFKTMSLKYEDTQEAPDVLYSAIASCS